MEMYQIYNTYESEIRRGDAVPERCGDWTKCEIRMLRDLRYEASDDITSNKASWACFSASVRVLKKNRVTYPGLD